MPIEAAIDTNVLVYWLTTDPIKAPISERVVRDGAVLSIQVLNEFARVALGKLKRPITDVRQSLRAAQLTCPVISVTYKVHIRGLDVVERYKLSVFDAMIVAAALEAGCTTLWSEDMHSGLVIDGLTVRNPYT